MSAGAEITRGDGPTRVLVTAARPLFREAVSGLLDEQPGLRVVAEAESLEESVAQAARTVPDVAVVDEDLPGEGAPGVARAIRSRVPACRVCVIAGEGTAADVLSAVEAGASAYVTKDGSSREIVDALDALMRDEAVIPPAVLGPVLTELRRRRPVPASSERISKLTPRELEVGALLTEGATNAAIAEILHISPATARTHVGRILSKLRVRSRVEAAAAITRAGIRTDHAS